MDVMYERKHPHLNGSIETTVHQRQDSTYTVNIRSNAPHGQELVIAVGEWATHRHQTLAAAQGAADDEVRLLGHECSDLCPPWPPAKQDVTH